MTNRVVLSSPQGVTCGDRALTSGFRYRFSASQAEYAGSIPVIGSTIYRLSPANTQNSKLAESAAVAAAVASHFFASSSYPAVAAIAGYSSTPAVASVEIRCRGQPENVMTRQLYPSPHILRKAPS